MCRCPTSKFQSSQMPKNSKWYQKMRRIIFFVYVQGSYLWFLTSQFFGIITLVNRRTLQIESGSIFSTRFLFTRFNIRVSKRLIYCMFDMEESIQNYKHQYTHHTAQWNSLEFENSSSSDCNAESTPLCTYLEFLHQTDTGMISRSCYKNYHLNYYTEVSHNIPVTPKSTHRWDAI